MLSPNKRKGGPIQNESPEKVIKDNPLLGAILDSSDETRDMHSITPEKQVESPIKENQNNNKVENTSSDMDSQEDFFWNSQCHAQVVKNEELKKKIANLEKENQSLRSQPLNLSKKIVNWKSTYNSTVEENTALKQKNDNLKIKCQETLHEPQHCQVQYGHILTLIHSIFQSTSLFLQNIVLYQVMILIHIM